MADQPVQFEHIRRSDLANPASAFHVQALGNRFRELGHCVVKLNEEQATLLEEGFATFTELFQGPEVKEVPGVKSFVDFYQGTSQDVPKSIHDCYALLNSLSRDIAAAIGSTLHLHSSHFDMLLDERPLKVGSKSTSTLQSFRYTSIEGQPMAPDHVDKGLLTLVACQKPGLEIKLPTSAGNWQPIEQKRGCIVAFAGHTMEFATAGLIKAVQHRVIAGKPEQRSGNTRAHRESFAFKLRCPAQVTIDCSSLERSGYHISDEYATPKQVLQLMQQFAATHSSINVASQTTAAQSNKRKVPPSSEDTNAVPQSQRARISNDTTITIRVVEMTGQKALYKLKRSTRMGKVLNEFAMTKGMSRMAAEFRFNGVSIEDHHTPLQLNLEDQSQVHCILKLAGD